MQGAYSLECLGMGEGTLHAQLRERSAAWTAAADSRTLVCAGGAGSSCAFRWEPRRPGAEEAANDDDSLAGLSVGKQRKTKRERQGSRGDAATKVRGGQKERGTGRRGNAGSF